MPYRTLAGGPPGLKIEVDDSTGSAGPDPSVTALMFILRGLAAQAGDQINQIPPAHHPTNVEMTFGLQALTDGGYAIVMDRSRASMQVTFSWAQQSASPAIDLLPPETRH